MASERVEKSLRQRRSIWRVGMLLSLLIHLILLLILRTQPARLTPYAAAGPAAGDPVAASGGGSMRAIVLRPQTEIKIPEPPESPLVKPIDVQLPEEPLLSLSDLELPDLGQGNERGPEAGPGLPGGEGRGDAGSAMEGLRRLIPPAPRGAIMTPLAHRPSSLKGREVTVWVFVNPVGAVDSVRLDVPTSDKNFNRILVREAWEWVFEPATRAGVAVAVWYSYTWKL